MRQFILFLAITFAILTSISAQKVKTQNVPITSMHLPSNPLEGDFKTYSVRVVDEDLNLTKYGFSSTTVQAMFDKFAKYELIPVNQDFTIKVTFFGENLVSRKDERYETTEGSGDKAKKVMRYKSTLTVRVPISYQIVDAAGNLMRDGQIRKYDKVAQIYKNGYRTNAALLQYMSNNQDELIVKTVTGIIKDEIKTFVERLKWEIDSYEYNRSVQIHTIKKAEKYGMEDFDKYAELAKSTLEKKAFDQSHLVTIAPAIEFWKKNLEDYSPKEKSEKEAFYASASNLGNLFLLDNKISEARSMMEKMKETESHKQGIYNFKLAIQQEEIALEKNKQIKQTFLNFNQAQAEGRLVKISNENNVGGKSGWVETDDYKAQGKIEIVMKKVNGDVMKGESVSHVVLTQNDGPTLRIKPGKIKMMEIEGTKVQLISLLPGDFVALEIVVSNQRAVFYRDYDSVDGDETYMVVDGQTGKMLISKLVLNINKAIAKKFGTCETVLKKAEASNYSKTVPSLEELVNDLGTCKN